MLVKVYLTKTFQQSEMRENKLLYGILLSLT